MWCFYVAKYSQRAKKVDDQCYWRCRVQQLLLTIRQSRRKLRQLTLLFMQKTPRIHTHKRHVHFQEQDGRLPGSRPSSAPAEPNAKAARKASKKMEKEAR